MSKDTKSSYYDAGGIETLDIIKAKLTPEQYQGYLLGNAIKYLCRANFKTSESERDVEKAANYAKWLSETLTEGSLKSSVPPDTSQLKNAYSVGIPIEDTKVIKPKKLLKQKSKRQVPNNS